MKWTTYVLEHWLICFSVYSLPASLRPLKGIKTPHYSPSLEQKKAVHLNSLTHSRHLLRHKPPKKALAEHCITRKQGKTGHPGQLPQLSLQVIIYQVVLIHGSNPAASNDTIWFKTPGWCSYTKMCATKHQGLQLSGWHVAVHIAPSTQSLAIVPIVLCIPREYTGSQHTWGESPRPAELCQNSTNKQTDAKQPKQGLTLHSSKSREVLCCQQRGWQLSYESFQ